MWKRESKRDSRRPVGHGHRWMGLLSLLLLTGGGLASGGTEADLPRVTVGPQTYRVQPQAGVMVRLTESEGVPALSVTGTGVAGPIVIELGWMALDAAPEAERSWVVGHQVRPVDLKAPARISLLIREHSGRDLRPVTPYHRTPVALRELAQEAPPAWQPRQLVVPLREQTTVLSGSILIEQLEGELLLSGLTVRDAAGAASAAEAQADRQARAAYEALLAELRQKADAWQPLLPRTRVYSRAQMKYGLELDYDHAWIDRPLFVNRAYRVPAEHVTPLPSYRRTLQKVADYGIDGLAFFPETTGRMGIFDMHAQAGVPGVELLPEWISGISPEAIRVKVDVIRRAMSSPASPRVGEKLLITSYAAEAHTPAEWRAALAAVREEVGDVFVFLPTVTRVVDLMAPFNEGRPIAVEEIERVQAVLRSWLDVCDGIYFNYPAAFRLPDFSFNEAFYRDLFIPVFKSVLAEPAYREKYLGLSAYKSHMNPDVGNSLHEDGTRTLRRSFEVAMAARPDVIILPEWDEFNENTCFRPTVYGSTTTQRIFRYYMSRIRGEALTPLPGDDPSLPNLIVSARKFVTLQEPVLIELLNVPDGSAFGRYEVELILRDEAGQPVRRFEPVRFAGDALQEHRLQFAAADHPGTRALVPELRIRDAAGRERIVRDGLHHVQVRATWSWDDLFVRQPLRALLPLEEVAFAWDETAEEIAVPGTAPEVAGQAPRVLTGRVVAPEPLAFVEVLADDDVVYSVDSNDAFSRADPDRVRILIDYRSVNPVTIRGAIVLRHARGTWLASGTVLHQPASRMDLAEDRVNLTSPASMHRRWVYLAMDRRDVPEAELAFEFEQAQFTVPVQEIFEREMISHSGAQGLHFVLAPYQRQVAMPVHLEAREAEFRVPVWPEIATEQYHLRAIAVSGRIYHGPPLLLPQEAGAPVDLPVRHGEDGTVTQVPVGADRVPELRYAFDPRRGAVLLAPGGRPFWASLGGYTNSTTGRGQYAMLLDRYPSQVTASAPQWAEDQGRDVLRFDGVGTFLTLPREVLPWRGPWTLRMELRPADDRDQTLFMQRILGHQLRGLKLEIVGGRLVATYRSTEHRFETGFAVPAGVWSTVEARYDLQHLTVRVNDREASFPLQGTALNLGHGVIGHDGRGAAFCGDLRALRIQHHAALATAP